MDALWGKLASEILMQNWDSALTDLDALKEIVDSNVMTLWFYSYSSIVSFFSFLFISSNLNITICTM